MERRLKMLGENQAEMEGFALQAASAVRAVIASGSFAPLPEAVQASTERFWRNIDSFEAFVEDKLVLHPDASASGTALFALYKEFCQDNNYKHALGRNRFYEKLSGLPGVWRTDSSTDKDRPFMGVRPAELAPLQLVVEAEAF